ncbi:Checkpoint protein hus1 [Elasticomyces elasticus]|nr:Checkpoint protein hus1 [Elasticomyces elasticus]
MLSLTIITSVQSSILANSGFDGANPTQIGQDGSHHGNQSEAGFGDDLRESSIDFTNRQERETTITQDIPVRVLAMASVEGIHQPRCREPDVHIVLPQLMQLKSISDRFTKLALASKAGTSVRSGFNDRIGPKLEMSANMHGCLKLKLKTDAMNITSTWTGLFNPELDPDHVGGEQGVAEHRSTKMRELGDSDGSSEEGWATVRIDGRDWSRVLSVGRLGGKVIACFCDDHALILYVYLSNDEDGGEESVLTYYVSSYSA